MNSSGNKTHFVNREKKVYISVSVAVFELFNCNLY